MNLDEAIIAAIIFILVSIILFAIYFREPYVKCNNEQQPVVAEYEVRCIEGHKVIFTTDGIANTFKECDE